jgi:hypothetical protein
VQIGASPESVGKTFHLTAGPERRMNTGTMVDLWIDRAAHHGIEIRQPVFGVPEDIAEAGMAGRRSLRLLEHLTPYLNVAVAFDRRQTEAFRPFGLSCGSVDRMSAPTGLLFRVDRFRHRPPLRTEVDRPMHACPRAGVKFQQGTKMRNCGYASKPWGRSAPTWPRASTTWRGRSGLATRNRALSSSAQAV